MSISATALQNILTRIKSYIDSHSGGASNFSDLGDVALNNPSNGQIPKYNSTTQKWENANETSGSSSFSTLNDVELTNLSNGQIPKYNATTQKWENSDESTAPTYTAGDGIDITNGTISTVQKLIRITQANFDALPLVEKNDVNKFYFIVDSEEFEGINNLVDLNDVDINNLQDKQVIQYDATTQKFINATIQSGGASNLVDLGDVSISNIQNNQLIVYDSTSQKFKNRVLNWSDIDSKPFATIGSGLSVVNNVLSADFKYLITDTEPATIENNTVVFVYE